MDAGEQTGLGVGPGAGDVMVAGTTRQAALRELIDRAAIHDILLRYARGVDARELESVAALFVAGAAYSGRLGIGTIETALARLRISLGRFQRTMHVVDHQLIEINGDRADSETYATAYHRPIGSAPTDFTVGVRYLDALARRGGAWLITRRVVEMEWQRHAPVNTVSEQHSETFS
ncbi:MAG: nuclear transport factor 2 family protein [Deltaproteobacteria bacterium]|nr:nuclear transport factor 2 family protein [Deltaproteobacteria bacterium]MBI3389880.1 nuclear transport factor 2 family protein [Deltaproteobacteria bacterium]